MKGTVKFFNAKKGWGFLTDSEGKDFFVHHTSILMNHFRMLHEDDVVAFELGTGNNGREQAINVTPILTMKMVKDSLKEENLHISNMEGVYDVKRYQVVDQNNVPQSSEYGMTFLELAAYAGFNVDDLVA